MLLVYTYVHNIPGIYSSKLHRIVHIYVMCVYYYSLLKFPLHALILLLLRLLLLLQPPLQYSSVSFFLPFLKLQSSKLEWTKNQPCYIAQRNKKKKEGKIFSFSSSSSFLSRPLSLPVSSLAIHVFFGPAFILSKPAGLSRSLSLPPVCAA